MVWESESRIVGGCLMASCLERFGPPWQAGTSRFDELGPALGGVGLEEVEVRAEGRCRIPLPGERGAEDARVVARERAPHTEPLECRNGMGPVRQREVGDPRSEDERVARRAELEGRAALRERLAEVAIFQRAQPVTDGIGRERERVPDGGGASELSGMEAQIAELRP